MATSTIKNNVIKSASIKIANVSLNEGTEYGYHYKILGASLPTNSKIIGCSMGPNYSLGFIVQVVNNTLIALEHPSLTTVPSNASDLTIYYI